MCDNLKIKGTMKVENIQKPTKLEQILLLSKGFIILRTLWYLISKDRQQKSQSKLNKSNPSQKTWQMFIHKKAICNYQI